MDFEGINLLTMYAVLFLAALVVALPIRYVLRGPANYSPGEAERLSPMAVAFLQEGQARAVETAITSMIHRGILAVRIREESLGKAKSATRYELIATQEIPGNLTEVERKVFETVVEAESPNVIYVLQAAKSSTRELESQLQAEGYLLDARNRRRARFLPPALMYVVIALNVVLMAIAFYHNRRTELLVLLTIAAIVGAIRLARPPWRSRRGDKAIDALTTKYKLKRARTIEPSTLTASDWVMLGAIFGADVLKACPIEGLHGALTVMPGASSPSAASQHCDGSSDLDDASYDGDGCGE